MLKSLELFGFKSFADRTVLEFSPGITGIVGPNGSGKSNVVDSIKWILGDQSAKSLRGKEMTDVIFNGSAGRKPAGFAEATLAFDNTKRLLNLDTDEVLVGRRLYRSGESEYLINRIPSRLKDVKDLFMGTGAGTSAYSIIEQGRVDVLLQATNVNRRIVFEEAAGVSKFNSRKADALRKLERVGQNLTRLTDIVEEVRNQVQTLRSQAGKAAKFREYTEQLKSLRLGLAADDCRSISRQLENSQAQFAGFSEQLALLTAQHDEIERQQAGIEAQVAGCEDQLRGVERQAAENREALATLEATLSHQLQRKSELEAEVARLRQQQEEMRSRAESATGELVRTEGDLQQITEHFSSRQAELTEREQKLRKLSDELLAAREELDQRRERQVVALQQSSLLRNRVGTFDSQLAALESTRKRAQSRWEHVLREIAQLDAELVRRREGIEGALGQASLQRERLQTLKTQREECVAKQDELFRESANIREERSACLARRTLLEDLESRQEGLGVGVKEILSRARDNPAVPWNTVLGSVADLLSVEIEHAAVMEVALGNRAQIIALTEFGPLLEYLHSGMCQISGRVGFCAMNLASAEILEVAPPSANAEPGEWARHFATTLVGQQATRSIVQLSGLPGVHGRADALVKGTPETANLAARLLCDTWVVESLDVAFRLATEHGPGLRFVTLQGELLEQDGTLYVGSVRSDTALISRKSELRGLRNDLIRMDRQVQVAEGDLAKVAAQIAELDRELITAQRESEGLTEHVGDLKSALRGLELQRDRLALERDGVQEELDQLTREEQDLKQQSVTSRDELAALDAEITQLGQLVEGADQNLATRDTELRQGQAQLTAEQLELAKQEERLHNLKHARERLDQERFQRDLQNDEAERRLQLVLSKVDQIQEYLIQSESQLDTLRQTQVALAAQVGEQQLARDAIRQQRSQLSEQELKLRHQRRELQDRQHAFELRVREHRQQIQHLAERLRDEYQVELIEVVNSGASARREWFSRRASRQQDNESGQMSLFPEDDPEESFPDELLELEEGPVDGDLRREIEDEIDRLRRKVKQMGNVNTESLKDLDELEGRFHRLQAQWQDLVEAKAALEEIVKRINQESRRLFLETFTKIREQFQELFRKLFGGGEGDVVLEDPENVLDCGIDVVARPPGKELRSISLLSGGEKTLTAVALLMAIFKSKPSPFCILDEVDAALDEGNVERYMKVVREFRDWTQFIVITHSKRTMSTADVLYGVTMEESGVSKRMSVRFDDISEDGSFTTAAA